MKQDFLIHIHPIFTGHEFCTLDYIENFHNKSKMPVVITPHFDLPETEDNHYEGYELRKSIMNEIKELSEKYSGLVFGGEFTAQNMMLFKDSEISKLTNIKIVSFHDILKFSNYVFDDEGKPIECATWAQRKLNPWIHTNKLSKKELLASLESIFKNFDVKVLGHINRNLKDMLTHKLSEKEIDRLTDEILDLAKQYNIIIEINTLSDIENNEVLISKCLDRDLKMVVGLDAHVNKQINPSTMNEILNKIPKDNQVSFSELMSH